MEESELEELLNYVNKNKDLTFTLDEIIGAWVDSYGEDIILEYSGFIQKLLNK